MSQKIQIEPRNVELPCGNIEGKRSGKDAEIERGNEGNIDGRRNAKPIHHREHECGRDEELPDELRFRSKTERTLLRHLRSIVDESKHTGEDDRQHDEGGIELWSGKQEYGDRHCHEHDHATHGGRSLLHEVAFGTIGADLLPDQVLLQSPDPKRHEHHRNERAQEHRKEHGEGRILCIHCKHYANSPLTIRSSSME